MIQVTELNYYYRRSKTLFQKESFSLERGNIVCLLGKNGEGKTTLMKLLAGHLLAKKGEIAIDGFDPSDRHPSLLRQIFFLPEEMKAMRCTVKDYFSAVAPMYPNYSQSIANELIREFQISWDDNLKNLSLGQRKKAYIALAISLRTPLLMMDEPTNALDIPSKTVFRKLMSRYINEDQLVIISTHQARDLEQTVDYVVAMLDNKIVCNKSIVEILSKLKFGEVTPENHSKALYMEMAIPHNMGVFPAESGIESFFSLELFFNALISNPQVLTFLN